MSRADIVPVETERDYSRVRAESPDEPLSVRDVMESHFKDIGDGEEAPPSDERAHEPIERDERGRFRPKAAKEPQETIQAHESGEAETIDVVPNPAIESEADNDPVLPPPSWAADAKDVWNQVPKRAQQEFVKRETDLRRGLQQATEKAAQIEREWSEVGQVLAPFENRFKRLGVTRGQVLNNMVGWQEYLDDESRRPQAFRDLAASYGTTLEQLAQVSAQQPAEPAYVREIRQQNQQLMQLFQQQSVAQKQQGEAQVVLELQSFASETDASGRLKHPHLEYLVDDIQQILPAVRASMPGASPKQLLSAAYDKAVWSNPSTRELELKKTAQPVTKQNVDRARAAKKLVNGEAMAPETVERPKDIRGAMHAAAEKLGL